MIEYMLMAITVLLAIITYRLYKIQKQLDIYEEWANGVDEFIDSAYIELEFEVDDET